MHPAILKADITELKADAIVNPANSSLFGGGGVDGAIHRKAGIELLKECQQLRRKKYPNGLPTGEVVVTKAYNLNAKIIIHTVGPIYGKEDINLLKKCYLNCLRLADENNCKKILFPAISTGAFGVPIQESARIVKEILTNYHSKIIEEIVLVLYYDRDFKIYLESFKD